MAIGRMVPRKGFDTAIQALTELPGTELLIAGGGDDDTTGAPIAMMDCARVGALRTPAG
ncbi:hypothetical protein [Nocardia cyriacigeorgica]|uniref:hypothetical protein n=1 Tax=Nocardia cyriacigeorgica TaxID=135487 RepID=UPI002458158E|nr:hypothetical protein [Nocardia cyriacigeorgica]